MFLTRLINKLKNNLTTIIGLFFIILFVSLFITSSKKQNELSNIENEESIITDLIQDEIPPYCEGLSYKESTLKFSDIKNLEIEMNNSRDWYTNLTELFLTDGVLIDSKYKKRFNAKVSVIFINNASCIFNSKIRISGDFKDHIKFSSKPLSSLDVHLQNGNILGITKFKLFLDSSRGSNGGENEVLLSIILREAGFISPRTSILPVKVNGSNINNYIFQEKPSKEMIEFHGYREGPIIETDEKFVFEFEKYSNRPFDQSREYVFFGKILNKNWSEKNIVNMNIAAEALQLYNLSIYSSYNPNSQMNYKALNYNPLSLYEFDAINFALNSTHGLTNHNRKFFYDKISEKFIPIYYDGDSNFLDNPKLNLRPDYKNLTEISHAAKNILENSNFDIKNIKNELNFYRLNYDIEKTDLIIKNLVKNLEEAIKLSSDNNFSQTLKQNISKTESHDVEYLFLDSQQYQICDQYFLHCKDPVKFSNLNQLLDIFDNTNSILFGKSKSEFLSSEDRPKKITVSTSYNLQENILINTFYGPEIFIDESRKVVEIFINNLNQKVVVSGNGTLSGWAFELDSSVNQALDTRQDELLLTGCLTFDNLHVEKISITASNQHCEDSVNFLRVNGDIDLISINNSRSDALDIDYSTLEIKFISIANSGNDCVDLSGGKYKIKDIYLEYCNDKGVSIGEKSTVSVDRLNVLNSNITTAIKDSSNVQIDELISSNTSICIAMYRKKQEFGPSMLKVFSKVCDAKNDDFIQHGSIYEE